MDQVNEIISEVLNFKNEFSQEEILEIEGLFDDGR